MLVDELKARAKQAMIARDSAATMILRLALGELQTAEARSGKSLTDEEAAAVLKKLIKSNEETIQLTTDETNREALVREVTLLREFLPKTLGLDEIVALLAPVAEAVRAAKAEGQATGVAMKHLKTSGAQVDAAEVVKAVQKLRA